MIQADLKQALIEPSSILLLHYFNTPHMYKFIEPVLFWLSQFSLVT